MAGDWKNATRDMVLESENRAFAFALPSLRDVADRMHAESRLDSVVGGCFICRDPLNNCPTPADCGIEKPGADRG